MVQKAGGFRSEFDSAQDYDLFFRVTELTNRIHHIPRVLYHWRRSESSSAISVRQKPEQLDASRRAIEDHLKRRGESAHVAVDWRTHAFRVRRELSEPKKIADYHSEFSAAREALEQCLESLTIENRLSELRDSHRPERQISRAHPPDLSRFPHRLLQFRRRANDSAAKNYAEPRNRCSMASFPRRQHRSDRIRSGSRSWPSMSSDRKSAR